MYLITPSRSTSALAITASLLSIAPPAPADVVTAIWGSNTSFSYEITHMPDLDQRRMAAPGILGLPNNGAMYCVPTSTLNMMMYCANHGFPAVLPGPGNWESNTLYNAATLNDIVMGVLMDTDPVDGTSGGWFSGAQDWLAQNSEGAKFNVEYKSFTGALGPNLNAIAKKGVQGYLVSFAYGYYDHIGTHKGLPYYQRVGGHIVTLAKAVRNGSNQQLWVRDPADDATNSTQSSFMNRLFDVDNMAAYVQINGQPYLRLFSALDFDPTAGSAAFIDEFVTIRPKAGYSFTNTGIIWAILIAQPWQIYGSLTPAASTDLAVSGALLDGVMTVDGTEAFTIDQPLTGGPAQVNAFDLLTRETQPLATIPNASQLALSPKGQLYIVTPFEVICIDLTEEEHPTKNAELPFEGTALAYDALLKEIVVLSVPDRRLIRYGDLTLPPTIMTIPTSIPLEGDGKVGVHPVTGMYWFLSQATDTLHGWMLDAAGASTFEQATAAGLKHPTSFDFDDDGHLFICDGSVVAELVKTDAAGWQPVEKSAFEGAHVGPIFRVTKSESNFDPLLHSGPGYVNIDPDQLIFGQPVLDCDGDIDRNGLVNVLDLLLVIGGWGACPIGPCPADVDGSRIVDVNDLLGAIGFWGVCP
ncbi:MAG: hypothetical protein L0Y44_05840 [Phycisphaerales bacterium]|nr:hypothetical protein [Phycisphaerales bacterium]MCI0630160.1 hypothetical protein [Phycisphaerales bacterium]MCI0674368.1 hypothetical protein [Phycisphaerales bacterium]